MIDSAYGRGIGLASTTRSALALALAMAMSLALWKRGRVDIPMGLKIEGDVDFASVFETMSLRPVT